MVLAWPLRVTTCQRSALLGGRCSHGQALPTLVARGHQGDSVLLRDGLHRTCPCLDQALAVTLHLLRWRRSPVLGATGAFAPVVEHITSAPQWLQQQRQWWSAQRHRSRGVRHASKAIGGQPVPSSRLVALSRRPHFRRRRRPSSAASTRVRSVLCMSACSTCVIGAHIRSRTSCGLYSSNSRQYTG